MAASSGDSVLKCDGTWRQAWTVMPRTSTTQSTAKTVSRSVRVLEAIRR